MARPEILKKYNLFGGLMEEQIESILHLMQHEEFDSEETIITQGKPNDKIYFIIEGSVSAIKHDIVLARFSEGDTFGEMEVLDVMPAVASIKSNTKIKLMSISNKALREIYKIDVKIFSLIVMNLARDLCRRLRKMNERFTSSSSPPIFI